MVIDAHFLTQVSSLSLNTQQLICETGSCLVAQNVSSEEEIQNFKSYPSSFLRPMYLKYPDMKAVLPVFSVVYIEHS